MPTVFTERFVEMLVHDLRSPLNVLRLSLHVIDEVTGGSAPSGADFRRQAEVGGLGEDVAMMRKNIDDIERMLVVLVEFYKLTAGVERSNFVPFDPSRMLRDQVDVFAEKNPAARVELELRGGPAVVTLDPTLAGRALSLCLANAAIAAEDQYPIRVVLRGGPSRCVVEVAVEGPPRDSVETVELAPEGYHRVLGNYGERRGLDLAAAAAISQLFGGRARLEVEPKRRSTIVLDWPAVTRPAAP